MKRHASLFFDDWLTDGARKPLVLRGARQVGKTWLVRDLAARAGRDLVEVNFERDPSFRKCFSVRDPTEVLGQLSLALGRKIEADRSILFLDEIQAAPEVLGALRWFYEERSTLPVIAAGSLLEFTLSEHAISMPVGRIGFRHIEPMSFEEFLEAHGQHPLTDELAAWHLGTEIPPTLHDVATRWFERYAMVGGMPEVVASDVADRGPRACRDLQRELVATFRADFARYAGRMDSNLLDHVLRSVAASLGRKFVYARVGDGVKAHQAKRALERLAAAKLCHLVRYTAGTGLPLGAETKETFRRAILLDVGLLHALVGTPANSVFPGLGALTPALRGQIADQMAGQQLRLSGPVGGDGPELFYWQREGGRPGEIDYLLQLEGRPVPVELKAGVAGAMKSLHQFMFEKRLDFAVRCDGNPPSLMTVDVKTTLGDAVVYRLVSLPPYLLAALPRVVAGL